MDSLAAVALVAVVIQKVVEHVRNYVPTLDGVGVPLFAAVLGFLASWGADLQVMSELLNRSVNVWVDYVFTGIGASAGAGFFADVTGRSG